VQRFCDVYHSLFGTIRGRLQRVAFVAASGRYVCIWQHYLPLASFYLLNRTDCEEEKDALAPRLFPQSATAGLLIDEQGAQGSFDIVLVEYIGEFLTRKKLLTLILLLRPGGYFIFEGDGNALVTLVHNELSEPIILASSNSRLTIVARRRLPTPTQNFFM
jgi:hypothetical protein